MRLRAYHEGALRDTKPCGGGIVREGPRRDAKPCGGVLARRAINGREGTRRPCGKHPSPQGFVLLRGASWLGLSRKASRSLAALRALRAKKHSAWLRVSSRPFADKISPSPTAAWLRVPSWRFVVSPPTAGVRTPGECAKFVSNHRGEKVPDFFKFYHGTVKILPRCRKSATAVP